MWQCPKCSKEFKNTNQNHYCVKPETVDDYIAAQPSEIQAILEKVRNTIQNIAPDAKEKISWQMPTYWQGENLIHFSAQKNHLSLHPGALEQIPFPERLAGYKTTKSVIQFPYDKPIDYELIADITRWRISCIETRV
jgi:uncharacterized protein YdhG (YjbR/CyaY superfamily)